MASNRMNTTDAIKKFLQVSSDEAVNNLMPHLPDFTDIDLSNPVKPFEVNQEALINCLKNAGIQYKEAKQSVLAKAKSMFKGKDISRVQKFEEQLAERIAGTFGLNPNELFKSVIQDILSTSREGVLETSTIYREKLAQGIISYFVEEFKKQEKYLSEIEKNIIGAFVIYFTVDNLNKVQGIHRALEMLNHLLFLDDQTMLATLIYRILNDLPVLGTSVLGTSKDLKNRLKDAACACFGITANGRQDIENAAVIAFCKTITSHGQALSIPQVQDDAVKSVLKRKFLTVYPDFDLFDLPALDVDQNQKNAEGEELRPARSKKC